MICRYAFFQIPLLFTIDAATIGLPIDLPLPRDTNTFIPTGAEIPVDKWNSIFSGQHLSAFANQVMFLKPAVKEGRGKPIEGVPTGHLGGAPQPHFVAPAAPLLLFEDSASQKSLQEIIRTPPDFQLLFPGKLFEGLPTAEIFHIWMDIGIKEVSRERAAFFP
jgi:hypothetical protein